MRALDFIFPRKCFGCGKSGVYICSSCINQVTNFGRHQRALGLKGGISLWRYEGVVRRAIINMKYRFALKIAEELASHATQEIEKYKNFLPKNPVLVPVPLFWLKHNWRGFNQAELMGKIIAQKMGWRFIPDLLMKKISSVPQVKLKARERRKNIKGTFSLNPNYQSLTINHQSLIIFDDVWTTGSTLKEGARILRRAGVKKVWALTIACSS
jgi:ComF family protein